MKMNRFATRGALALGIAGGLLMIIGLCLFFSVFFTGMSVEAPSSPTLVPRGFSGSMSGRITMGPPPEFVRGVVGMLLTAVGGFLIKVATGIGLVGNAGPISSWFGRNVLSNLQGQSQPGVHQTKTVTKIRCRNCQALNDETAKYCSQCGSEV